MRGLAIGSKHWAMFVHLSMPSLDASCFSMAETAALGMNHRCVEILPAAASNPSQHSHPRTVVEV